MFQILLLSLAVFAADPVVNVLDPATLHDLESHGFSLGDLLGDGSLTKTSDLTKKSAGWRDVMQVIGSNLTHDKNDQLVSGSGDIPDLVSKLRGFNDQSHEYKITTPANNSAYPYLVERDGDEPRHFDPRWLSSEYGALKLVAVVNRLDRVDITRDSCGEVRFIYRLSYKSKTSSSSLPFFVNVVEQYPKKASCAEFAKAWMSPFTKAALKDLSFRQLETNFQSVRFTSNYMKDFGGQAMYMQRIFRRFGDRLTPVALENTPDLAAFEKNPALLKNLVSDLKAGLLDLDRGILNLPEKYLAKLSISWSTLGRARSVNRPFTELFEKHRDLLREIDISKLTYIRSQEALFERLDNLSCMGCHQSGGTAGFHMLGAADPDFSHPFNRQEVALSPHALAEISRREQYTRDVAAGRAGNPFRPHSTFSSAKWTSTGAPSFDKLKVGALCFAQPTFYGQPACDCRKTVSGSSARLGECVAAKPTAGSVCWMGDLTDTHLDSLHAFTDKWKLTGPVLKDRGTYSCVLPSSGAPLGRMSRRCTLDEENFNVDITRDTTEVCANQGGQGFDMCAASGDSGACLETKVARSMLDTCSSDRTCREDYICQKFPDYQKISKADYVRKKNGKLINDSTPDKINGAKIAAARDRGVGFCVPTYFLFNMRLDGHPSPVSGLPPPAPTYNAKLPQRGLKK